MNALLKGIGAVLLVLGYLIWTAAGLFGFFLSIGFVLATLGPLAAIIAFFIFPATLAAVPAIVGFASGVWTVAIVVYGGAVLGMVVLGVGSALCGID